MSLCKTCGIDLGIDPYIVYCNDFCQTEHFIRGIMENPTNLTELYSQYLKDENLKLDNLPWDTDYDMAYALLRKRNEDLERISYEAKTRAVAVNHRMRKANPAISALGTSDSSVPVDAWKEKEKQKKKVYNQIEKVVAGWIQLGNTDEEIMDILCSGTTAKYKGSDVREALAKVRE